MPVAQKTKPEQLNPTPPLKWAGGKRWLIPTLLPLWQAAKADRLVEPFCGGLAVSLGLAPEHALLNDRNPHLVGFYQQLQAGLICTEAFENTKDCYYMMRKRFNDLIAQGQAQSSEAAQLFYYLNRTGYNGLCRFNAKGFFNVPFGQYKTISYQADFLAYQKILSAWEFTACDFEALQCNTTDWIYADPPYDVPFVQYGQHGFNWEDQVRLAAWLAKQPCPVVVSNQATDRILALYTELGFKIEILNAPRMIACTGNRARAKEMLATKF